jgi:hypothetical protein
MKITSHTDHLEYAILSLALPKLLDFLISIAVSSLEAVSSQQPE